MQIILSVLITLYTIKCKSLYEPQIKRYSSIRFSGIKAHSLGIKKQ